MEELKITIELEAKSWRFRFRSFPDFARITRSSEETSIFRTNLVLENYPGYSKNGKRGNARILAYFQQHMNPGFVQVCANSD
jgi:hypothetical protein